jgi:diguanylate cyclase (GGDEF)-like protein/PAS domain S-box-containing protein
MTTGAGRARSPSDVRVRLPHREAPDVGKFSLRGSRRRPVRRGGMSELNKDRDRLLLPQHEAERPLEEQRLQVETALNSLTQGLCMFDAEGRVILFNRRYVEMLHVSVEDVAGLSLLDLLKHRKALGYFTGDPDETFAAVLASARAGRSKTLIRESGDGSVMRIVDHPRSDGGWVATLEDITEQRRLEKQRLQDQELLKSVVENVPVMIVVKDAVERRYIHANRAAETFWGFSREQVIGKTLLEVFPGDESARAVDRADAAALESDETPSAGALRKMTIGGIERLVMSKRHAIRDADGKAQLLVTVIEDVTDRKRIEFERDRDREFLNQIIDNVPTSVIVRDADTRRYVLVNHAAMQHFGVSSGDIIDKTPSEVFPKATGDLIASHDEQLLQSGGSMFFDEYPLDTRGVGLRTVTSKKMVIRDKSGAPRYLLGVIDDVTDRKKAEERIAHLAHYDALTDLPNRVHFREQLEQALKRVRRGERLAVLYFDLDKFKGVNDTLGHQGGDELLKSIATRLRGCLRDTDIVSRLGGDEFAIVQTAVRDPNDVIDLVKRIHEAIREPWELSGHQVSADASIGIAMAPDDGTEPDQLLKNADMAMYGAKGDGRGTYRFFEADMDARMKSRRALEFDLRQAVMCGEFELHYQPLVNIRDSRIVGCEALLRWHHPKRGMISPAEFIPIAEETGIINQLGEWVLRTACAEAVRWPDDIMVTVNVSPVQFNSENLVQTVVSALAASGLPAQRLELEITESVLLCDDDATLLMLHQLKKLGVRIAMDDFGTGYSSLNYLRRFPFDKIKIDRAFIKDVAEQDGSWAIVQAVVGIAKSRNIVTTAEGVETEAQLEYLRVLGCTEMQGYLFSPPRPAAEIMRLLQPRQARARSVA